MQTGVLRAVRGMFKLAFSGLVLIGATAHAQTVTVTPASQTTTVGSEISVTVMASDLLPNGLGSYNLDLSFQEGVLAFDHVVDGLGMGNAFGLTYALSGGVLTLTDTSLDDEATLLALQDPSFALFTVYFDAVGVGTSALSLSGVTLADAYGLELGYALNDASVTVQAVSAIPEPGTLSLMLTGGLAGLWRRRRAARPSA